MEVHGELFLVVVYTTIAFLLIRAVLMLLVKACRWSKQKLLSAKPRQAVSHCVPADAPP